MRARGERDVNGKNAHAERGLRAKVLGNSSGVAESPCGDLALVGSAQEALEEVRARVKDGEDIQTAIRAVPGAHRSLSEALHISQPYVRQLVCTRFLTAGVARAFAEAVGATMDRVRDDFRIPRTFKSETRVRKCSNCGTKFEASRYIFRCARCKNMDDTDWP